MKEQTYKISGVRLQEIMTAIQPILEEHKLTVEEFVALFGLSMFWRHRFGHYGAGISRDEKP
jgi:hypothetical protein